MRKRASARASGTHLYVRVQQHAQRQRQSRRDADHGTEALRLGERQDEMGTGDVRADGEHGGGEVG